MRQYNNVQSTVHPIPLEIGTDTVFSRSNIHTIEKDEQTIYEYDEIQYTTTEYLREIVPQLESAIAELSILVGGGGDVQ